MSEVVNDTLKAISISLLMEQVLAPRFDFQPKIAASGPTEGLDYGPDGYQEGRSNVGVDPKTGQVQMEVAGLLAPESDEARRVISEDLNDLFSNFVQDREAVERGVFDQNLMPQELTQMKMGKIVAARYPNLSAHDKELVRQHMIAKMNLSQRGHQLSLDDVAGDGAEPQFGSGAAASSGPRDVHNTAFVDAPLCAGCPRARY